MMLLKEVMKTLGAHDRNALAKRAAKKPDEIFPKLFPLVAQAAAKGDPVARDVLLSAAAALADTAQTVIKSLGLTRKAFTLAKAGGVFGRSAILDRSLDAQLRKLAPRARIGPLRVSPAWVAAEMARMPRGKAVHDH